MAITDMADNYNISIHAPREGSDHVGKPLTCSHHISIHAPREGSDATRTIHSTGFIHFYPRSPRGERQPAEAGICLCTPFLSTLPARGAT